MQLEGITIHVIGMHNNNNHANQELRAITMQFALRVNTGAWCGFYLLQNS